MAQLTPVAIQFSIIYTWEPHPLLPVTYVFAHSKYTRFWPFSIVAGYHNLNACRALLSVAAQWLPAPFCLCNLSSTIITSTWGYHFLCGLNFSRTRIGTGTDLLIPFILSLPSLLSIFLSLPLPFYEQFSNCRTATKTVKIMLSIDVLLLLNWSRIESSFFVYFLFMYFINLPTVRAIA